MADLDPLIRYRKHGVDEKRRVLGQLYREQEMLQRQKETIQKQMQIEQDLANEMGSTDAIAYLGRYLEGARKKIKAIDAAVKKLETRIIAAREDVRTAFSEMKKVEIVQRNREKEEEAEAKRKEDIEYADIAIEGYRRKLEEDK